MKLINEQWLFLQDVALLIEYIRSTGWSATGGELFRTIEQQHIYVEWGLSKTLDSKHLTRLAIDFNFFTPEGTLTWDKDEIQHIGDYWESLSPQNKWGGNFIGFVDTPHFERSH